MPSLPSPRSPQLVAFAPALPAPTLPAALARRGAGWLTRPVATPRALRRIFVVGCQRAGTTLVQARLAAVGGLLTLPETHFFARLLGEPDAAGRRRWQSRLLYARPHTHDRLAEVLQPVLQGRPLRRHLSGRGYVGEFIGLLDAAAATQGAAGWLEKTPQHFVYIDMIEALCPDALFVHVTRAGEDVVASAVEAEMRYAATHDFRGGVAEWVGQWNRAAEAHLRYAGRPHHHVVALEDLVDDAESTMDRLLAFADLAPRAEPLRAGRVADLRAEPWKREAVAGAVQRPARKFEALFGPQTQAWIRSQLLDYRLLRGEIARRQR